MDKSIASILLSPKIKKIRSKNFLTFIMDHGESEAVILYEEMNATLLLIDDKKARQIAESLNVKCIGTLALLLKAKKEGKIAYLKPVFKLLIANGRFYSKSILNEMLSQCNEPHID